jgi:predicted dithiol-disulfide oxidoreductase (DUF899 family)
MTAHMTGTREEWFAARLGLLKEEEELTRRSDGLARRRQELPWVRVSTYARGVDPFFGFYHWLDRAPKRRNETGPWFRRHDEYDKR